MAMSRSKCPKCGQVFDKDNEECKHCGYSLLEGNTTAALISIPDHENKEVTEVDPIKENEEAVLVIKKGPVIGQRIDVSQDEIIIGRDPKCDIFLNDITVSRRHAKLIYTDSAEIRDTGSLNGTYVNNERTESAKLRSGDEIQIGKFVLVYLSK
jgi:RNA polymerase subunit RPABC4/transcription elongation factor Spt4